jgi:hypothetical protein
VTPSRLLRSGGGEAETATLVPFCTWSLLQLIEAATRSDQPGPR